MPDTTITIKEQDWSCMVRNELDKISYVIIVFDKKNSFLKNVHFCAFKINFIFILFS